MDIVKEKFAQYLAEEEINEVLNLGGVIVCTSNDGVVDVFNKTINRTKKLKRLLGITIPDIDRVKVISCIDFDEYNCLASIEYCSMLDNNKQRNGNKQSRVMILSNDADKITKATEKVVKCLSEQSAVARSYEDLSKCNTFKVDAVVNNVHLNNPVTIERGVTLNCPQNAIPAIFSALKDKAQPQMEEFE